MQLSPLRDERQNLAQDVRVHARVPDDAAAAHALASRLKLRLHQDDRVGTYGSLHLAEVL